MPKRKMKLDLELAAETKDIVALAFFNGLHRRCARGNRVPHLRWQIRILAYNASRNEEHHEARGGHGLQVAPAETE
jgi:hypothetical protein